MTQYNYLIPRIAREIIGLINNSTTPNAIDIAPSTPKYIVSETASYTRTNCALIACAAAEAKNHNAIVCPAKAAGASFVVADKPTGDNNNSPITTKKNDATTHSGFTKPEPAKTIATIIIKNEAPEKNNDNENFIGVDGPRSPNFVHINANNGAIKMMNIGLSDWNHAAGMSKLPNIKSVRVSTKVAKIVAD